MHFNLLQTSDNTRTTLRNQNQKMNSFLVFKIFLVATFINVVVGKATLNLSDANSPIGANELNSVLEDDKIEVGVFDVRPQLIRETEGYIRTSYPVPEGKHTILATFDL